MKVLIAREQLYAIAESNLCKPATYIETFQQQAERIHVHAK